MAFSIFGKRPTEPDQPSAPEPQEPKRGLFDRMKQAVTRTRESFTESISSVIALTREVDETTLVNLEPLLLAADLGAPTTAIVMENLRQRALRTGIQGGDELKQLLKSELKADPRRCSPPHQAPRRTTRSHHDGRRQRHRQNHHHRQARRLLHRRKRGPARTVLLCAADTFRAAAIEQLEVWAQRSDVQIIKTKQGGDPSAALYDACAAAKARGTQILIVDTAGRLHTKTDLMKELDKMRRTAEKLVPGAPHQTLLVMDATTGQNGLQQARLFTEAAHVTGIVLTKLDGTAKGGIVLAIATELKLPVIYAGIGEKLEDIIPFDSSAFVDSLLD